MESFTSKNAKDTQKFAAKIAREILGSKHRKHAAVVALTGDLGAGKTTFAQGFARALGVKKHIISPTFVIFRRYALSDLRFAAFVHVDAYRLSDAKELLKLGFKRILDDQQNIVLIEWAERVKDILPSDALWIRMAHGKTETERSFSLKTPKI